MLDGFTEMAGGFTFTMWIFYGLAGLSLFTLRFSRPDAARPFRCWGYPVVPGLFVASSALMTLLSVMGDVRANGWRATSLLWILVLLAGVPVYFAWDSVRSRRTASGPPA
jgi:APA family basic amino acid/polyamine antiporter